MSDEYDANRAKIEIESDGTAWGTVVKINGEPVSNCVKVTFTIETDDVARATVELDHVPLTFTGLLAEKTAAHGG